MSLLKGKSSVVYKMLIQKFRVLFFIFFIFSQNIYCATAGSDSFVGAPQAHFVFPAGENGTNKIANYAVMDDGFTLEDSSTTCSVASIFPIAGSRIQMNGGKLFLFRDIVFTNTSKNIFSSGRIEGNDYLIFLSEGMQEIAYPISFWNTGICFDGDISFRASMIFYGDCLIYGKGNFLDLTNGSLSVAAEGQLTLENLKITGIKESNLKCNQNSASIILKNSKLHLSRDFQFDTGSILFDLDVVISGTSAFVYSTGMGSTINSNSVLYFDEGTTFSYAPSKSSRDLLYMIDATSCLYLNGCTLYLTKTGMRLTRGRLFLDNQVTFSSQGNVVSEAICFGDGNSSNDLDIQILSGAQVNVYGRLEYENTA